MAGLTGSTIATSYDQLLISDNASGGNGSSLVAIKDGDGGTTFCISLTDASTGKAVLAVDGSHANGTEVQIDNSATDGDAFLSFQLSGTSKFTMGVDDGDSDKFKIGTTAIGTGTMFALDTNSKISLSNNDSGGTGGADSTSGNTFFGYLAGTNSEAGSHNNTLIGHKAAGAGTWANFENNVVIGTSAGAAATTADQCVIIGQNAGTAITGSEDVVLIGQGAGSTLTDNVDKVVFIGRNAGSTTNDTAATGSVGIGHSALAALTSGANNIAIGLSALAASTQGDDNIAIGKNAMSTMGSDDGNDNNIAIGTSALLTAGGSGEVATSNIAIGVNALKLNQTGDYNVCVGVSSGDALTGANSCVAVGTSALGAVATQDGTTAIGHQALTALTSGARNTAVGYQTLDAMTQGDDNIAIGYQALSALGSTDGCDKNIAIGNYAMDAADGNEAGHIAIGHNSLGALNTNGAERTICIGIEAGASLNSADADYNIIMGYTAGTGGTGSMAKCVVIGGYAMNATAGNAQTGTIAIGYDALTSLTSGLYNTAMGYEAGQFATTAAASTFIGFQAAKGITGAKLTGNDNTVIGNNAGLLLQGASNSNTFVGSKAGDEVTTGSYNTLVGYQAMHNADGAEDENTCIGYQAGTNIDGGSGNVMIGSNCTASTAASSNQIVVGKDAVGQVDNSVVLGNASTTAVYMAQDSGARVYGSGATLGEGTFAGSAETLRLRPTSDSGSNDYIIFSEVGGTGESIHVRYANDNGVVGTIKTNGSATSFNTSSDYRLKENEVLISDGLTRLNKLKPYRFNFKADDSKTVDGFFAHEVSDIVPEAVTGAKDAVDSDGNIESQGIDQSKLVPILVKAVQELSQQVEDLKAKIN
jgi:hypothetical protein